MVSAQVSSVARIESADRDRIPLEGHGIEFSVGVVTFQSYTEHIFRTIMRRTTSHCSPYGGVCQNGDDISVECGLRWSPDR